MASIKSGVGNLNNIFSGEPFGLPQGAVMARDGALVVQMVATGTLNPGDAVLQDFATGIFQVTKAASADSTSRFGIAVTGATAGQDIWVAVMGFAQAISGAAIAAGAAIATSANAAGQVKTAAAAGGRTNLGWALGAPGGAGVFFTTWLDKS